MLVAWVFVLWCWLALLWCLLDCGFGFIQFCSLCCSFGCDIVYMVCVVIADFGLRYCCVWHVNSVGYARSDVVLVVYLF